MSSGGEELSEVVVERGRGTSLVWLVPLVAVLIGGYMGWHAWQNRGVEIVIHYPTAEWVEAGKTKIEFRSVEIGHVDEVVIHLEGVELHCTVDRAAEPYLTEDAKFWIEHPRVGEGGVSGLGTLLSGAYIAMRAGDTGKKPTRDFQGLDDPPVEPAGVKGLRLVLHAGELYSLGPGAPVLYLQQPVGKVDSYELSEDGRGFDVHLFIDEEYSHLVRRDSRFWNAGGIQVSASLRQVDVTTPSLAAMIRGGIAFDSPAGTASAAAEDGASYWLHEDRSDVDGFAYRYGGLRVTVEAPQLGGVVVGDPVSYRELMVGEVVSSELAEDSRRVRLHLNIQDRYATLVRSNSVFWNASGISANLGLTGLHIHAESLQDIVAGGVAFATPDPPGSRVKSGSVFRLHPEVKDDWLKWKPVLSRGSHPQAKGDEAKPESEARFVHHEGKSEEEAAEDAEPQPDARARHHEKRHSHLLRRR